MTKIKSEKKLEEHVITERRRRNTESARKCRKNKMLLINNLMNNNMILQKRILERSISQQITRSTQTDSLDLFEISKQVPTLFDTTLNSFEYCNLDM